MIHYSARVFRLPSDYPPTSDYDGGAPVEVPAAGAADADADADASKAATRSLSFLFSDFIASKTSP